MPTCCRLRILRVRGHSEERGGRIGIDMEPLVVARGELVDRGRLRISSDRGSTGDAVWSSATSVEPSSRLPLAAVGFGGAVSPSFHLSSS